MRKPAMTAAFDVGNVLVDHAAIVAINGSIVPVNGNCEAGSSSVRASYPSEQRENGQALRGDSGCGTD
jgi:hypothetical protein